MLSLAASGAYLAFMKSQVTNFLQGVLTLYLVATAWATTRRREGETGIFDWVALLVVLAGWATRRRFFFWAVGNLNGVSYVGALALLFSFFSPSFFFSPT